MITLRALSDSILQHIATAFHLSTREVIDAGSTVTLLDATSHHAGDITTNAAMTLARLLKKNPRANAELIVATLTEARAHDNLIQTYVESIAIAGPGFINITLAPAFWMAITTHLHAHTENYFKSEIASTDKKSYLIEFVSANPTGPLHLGHGRNAIIGNILERVLKFAGHTAHTEFYINDAGVQMQKLGASLKARCIQQLGGTADIPEEGYHGEYLIAMAADCIAEKGTDVIEHSVGFFTEYAQQRLVEQQKQELAAYGVTFDRWFSELTLHKNGSIPAALNELEKRGYLYRNEGALWFKSTEFGDDKDRVIQKQDGSLTYIAPDIAYHVDKFSRGIDRLVNIVGQDHHGYVLRLKGTLAALGYNPDHLDVILYQLVSLKQGETPLKMSKRSGTFIGLQEVIDTVGVDAARFFFLHKKADSHLELDIDVALKQTQENPVFYLQYAYVRTVSIGQKAATAHLHPHGAIQPFAPEEIVVLKKILGFSSVINAVTEQYATHTLATYALELAQTFHTFYTNNKVIDPAHITTSNRRLALVHAVHQVLKLTLDLLGLSKPESM